MKPKTDKELLIELIIGLITGSVIGYYMLTTDFTKEEKDMIVTTTLLMPD